MTDDFICEFIISRIIPFVVIYKANLGFHSSITLLHILELAIENSTTKRYAILMHHTYTRTNQLPGCPLQPGFG